MIFSRDLQQNEDKNEFFYGFLQKRNNRKLCIKPKLQNIFKHYGI